VIENGAPLKEIELPTPEPKGAEVLLEVTHCGVCHSDLHIWEGYYDIGGGQKMSLKDRGVTLPLAMGHENIVSVDVSAEKRQAALKAGAHKVVDGNGEDVARRIMETAGGPVLAIVDLVNGTATARFAFGALRKGGKLVRVGLFGGELMLPLPIMAIRALTVQGSYVGNPKELRELVKLAQDGKLQALPVATVPQNQAYDALMRLRDGKVTGRLVLRADAA
jgi:alcohol dehydrogenase/propanol-preferring alcohol dehydrogenase